MAGGRALRLSVRELGLLAELARHEGRIVRREELYERVWGTPLRAGDRTVDVYVRKLRVKLEQALPRVALHPHARRASATASRPSVHTIFTPTRQLDNRLSVATL